MVLLSVYIFRILCLIVMAIGLLIGPMLMDKWNNREGQRSADEQKTQNIESSRRSRRRRLRETELRDDQLCIVCRENPRELILLPCGHVCLCEDCSDNIQSACPVCRAPIVQKNAAYII